MRTDSSQPPVVAPWHRLPALWLAALLAAGILLDNLLSPALILVFSCWLLAILYLAAVAQFRTGIGPFQRSVSFAAIMLTGTLVAGLFGRTLEVKRRFTASTDGRVAVQGYVSAPPRVSPGRYGGADRLAFVLDVTAEKRAGDTSWQRVSYRLNVTVDNSGALSVAGGDRLALAAELLPAGGYANPGGFDWREYWGRRFVVGSARVENGDCVRHLSADNRLGIRRLAAMLQARLLELHSRLYPDPRIRAVAGAILLGDRRGLDRATRNWFARSGTIHVLVVSGLHLGFIAGAVYLLLSLALGRGWASAGLTSAILLIYALATGGRPPVVRAWLLVSFAMFALPAGRQRVVLNSLAAAFAVLLLLNPSWLFDPGFQLSFAAVAGIGLALPFVESRVSRRDWWSSRPRRWAFPLVAASLVAQLAVAPLLAWHFGRFSPAAFLANPPVVCMAGVCVIGGFAADIAGLIWLGAGKFIAFWVAFPLAAMTAVARWFASFAWSSVAVQSPGPAGVLLFWVALLLAAGLVGGARKNAGRLILVLLLWLNITQWSPLLSGLRKRTEITFLDLGEATAPVVRFPGGATLLADQAGRSGPGYMVAGELIGPYLYRYCGGSLDYLLLRGRATWSWTGRILRQFKPRVVIVAGSELPDETAAQLRDYCSWRGIALRRATTADTLVAGGAKLYFSGRALLPVVEYDGRRVLLAGERSETIDAAMLSGCSVVESTRAVNTGSTATWQVAPQPVGIAPGNRIVTSRSGAATFVLTAGGIRVETVRDGRVRAGADGQT